jgi:hypothetical protein
VGDDERAYDLYFCSGDSIPTDNYLRLYGRSVRCLAR